MGRGGRSVNGQPKDVMELRPRTATKMNAPIPRSVIEVRHQRLLARSHRHPNQLLANLLPRRLPPLAQMPLHRHPKTPPLEPRPSLPFPPDRHSLNAKSMKWTCSLQTVLPHLHRMVRQSVCPSCLETIANRIAITTLVGRMPVPLLENPPLALDPRGNSTLLGISSIFLECLMDGIHLEEANAAASPRLPVPWDTISTK